MAEPEHTTDTHPHTSAQIPISDGQPFANGGALQGPGPPPAAAPPLRGRACTDASGRVLRLREEGAEANTPALTEPSAVVTDGGAPAKRGSRKGADQALAADPAPSECLSEACYRLLRHAAVSFRSSDISVFYCRPLAVTTNAHRRMHSIHRNPGAHEDVYTEFGGLPHVCSGVVVEWGDSESAGDGERRTQPPGSV